MKPSQLALLLILAGTTASGAELCADVPRKIEPDMQIAESDLTTEAAAKAASQPQTSLPLKSTDIVLDYGVRNRLQVLRGYTLRQHALEVIQKHGIASTEAKAAKDEFCTWLTEHGFWYD